MSQKKILLKTTIGDVDDDWNISRFSILKSHLESLGHEVTASNRRGLHDRDTDLENLDEV